MRDFCLILALLAVPGPEPPSGPPGGTPPGRIPGRVEVNSQPSLRALLGAGRWAWAYPERLLPGRLPGWTRVSGPGDPGLFPKDAWRKPVLLKHARSGARASVNCYERETAAPGAASGGGGTPAAPQLEPDYHYRPLPFHRIPAAVAEGPGERSVVVVRLGSHLFKVECGGAGPARRRRARALSIAEAVRRFHAGRR